MALQSLLECPTGPGLDPACRLGPRILHFTPTNQLGEHEGDSKWWYSWVPVVAPIAAEMVAVALFKADLRIISIERLRNLSLLAST